MRSCSCTAAVVPSGDWAAGAGGSRSAPISFAHVLFSDGRISRAGRCRWRERRGSLWCSRSGAPMAPCISSLVRPPASSGPRGRPPARRPSAHASRPLPPTCCRRMKGVAPAFRSTGPSRGRRGASGEPAPHRQPKLAPELCSLPLPADAPEGWWNLHVLGTDGKVRLLYRLAGMRLGGYKPGATAARAMPLLASLHCDPPRGVVHDCACVCVCVCRLSWRRLRPSGGAPPLPVAPPRAGGGGAAHGCRVCCTHVAVRPEVGLGLWIKGMEEA